MFRRILIILSSIVGIFLILYFLNFLLQYQLAVRPFGFILERLKLSQNTFSQYLSNIFSSNQKEEQIKILEKEKIDLLNKVYQLRAACKIEEELRPWIKQTLKEEFSSIPVSFLTFDPTGNLDYVTLNKGKADGIKEGAALVALDNVIIGKVIKTSKHTAQAVLVTSPHLSLNAIVLNESLSPGIVEGQLGLGVKLTLVLPQEEIKENQLVVTSGWEEFIPKGLIIGQISQVVYQEGNLFKEAYLKLPLDLERLWSARVIIPSF